MPTTPKPIQSLLKEAEEICKKLSLEAGKIGLNHDFTLDGRFVGDVGELIASKFFDIRLHKIQKKRDDGTCKIGSKEYGVQVKCRRKSDVLDMYSVPDILLVIHFDDDWSKWDVVYNGPGTVVSESSNVRVDKDGKVFRHGATKAGHRLNLKDLKEAMKNVSKNALAVPKC